MVLDLMQALFKADAPGAPPRPNVAAIDKVIPIISDDPAMRDQLKAMTPADIKRTVGAFETYYRDVGQALRTGYPQVRAKDISEIDQRLVGTSAFANSLAPSMARMHQLRTRNEASRRATQLAFALHAYKSQTGKWPASLDELPSKYGQILRTDPFTGQAFGYRRGSDGPVVYSRSENGRDDGGVHVPTWSDDKSSASDDYVFWPPQEK